MTNSWVGAPVRKTAGSGVFSAMLKAWGGSTRGASVLGAVFAVHRWLYRRCESCGSGSTYAWIACRRSALVERPAGAREHVVTYPGRACAKCLAAILDGRRPA